MTTLAQNTLKKGMSFQRYLSKSIQLPLLKFRFSNLNEISVTQTPQKNQGNALQEIKSKGFTISRLNLSPHEYWITQGQGMEKPFTGDKWSETAAGFYSCTVCQSRLFTSEHKFQTPTGIASFWNHERNAVEINKKHIFCMKCKSHLGLVFQDGPPPTFMRLSVNSAALKFMKKEQAEDPHFLHRKRKQLFFAEAQEKNKL